MQDIEDEESVVVGVFGGYADGVTASGSRALGGIDFEDGGGGGGVGEVELGGEIGVDVVNESGGGVVAREVIEVIKE